MAWGMMLRKLSLNTWVDGIVTKLIRAWEMAQGKGAWEWALEHGAWGIIQFCHLTHGSG